jgi:hypothetical protein
MTSGNEGVYEMELQSVCESSGEPSEESERTPVSQLLPTSVPFHYILQYICTVEWFSALAIILFERFEGTYVHLHAVLQQVIRKT